MPRRHRNMKGGFWDNIGSTLSGWGTSISQGANSAWDKTKKATTSSTSTYTPTTTSTYTSPSTTSTYTPSTQSSYNTTGGRRKRVRTKKNKYGGSYRSNISLTNMASTAASFSGKTAQPHVWVGGKTKRRHHKRKSTRRNKY